MDINNFAVMNYKGSELLCLVEDNYFASSAWLKGQEAFNQVSGSSFGVFTGDDDLSYKEDKHKFILPTEEKVLELLPKCCSSFIERVKHWTGVTLEKNFS